MPTWSRTSRLWILLIAFLTLAVVTVLIPPFAQDPSYHQFADRRELFSVPNFANVISNLAFLLPAFWGVQLLRRSQRDMLPETNGARLSLALFLFGLGATGLGSAYYHWQPTTPRLFWDRLPMTISFSSLLALLFIHRVSAPLGKKPLLALLVLGVLSVIYWIESEQRGHGDLRFYAAVQFGFGFLALLILKLFHGAKPPTRSLLTMFGFYGVAKVCEILDAQIFMMTGEILSGHSLKHLVAGIGCWVFLIGWRRASSDGQA